MSSLIRVEGARQNNLKNLTFELPLNQFIVVTGLSGSGKTSLAFDTLYAEGQRRYAETFSPYTRQFLERINKPQVDRISGIPPAIAISQVNTVKTSRSTVGTMTEIASYLKLLFAQMAQLCCPHCQRHIRPWTADEIAEELLKTSAGSEVYILFAVDFPTHTPWGQMSAFIQAQGWMRIWNAGRAQRLDELSEISELEKKGEHWRVYVVQDRLKVERERRARLMEALGVVLKLGKGVVMVQSQNGATLKYANRWYCPYDEVEFDPPSEGIFSFNSAVGACPTCRGFGRSIEIDYNLAIPDQSRSILQGAVKTFTTQSFDECQKDLLRGCRRQKIPVDVPFISLSEEQKYFVVYGEPSRGRSLKEIWDAGGWYGVKGFFDWLETQTYKMHIRVLLSRYRVYRVCPTCHGSRLQKKAQWWSVASKTLPQVNETPVDELAPFFEMLQSKDESTRIILEQIRSRLSFLEQVGLGYLTLNRASRTLSGGEFQRVNLTTCLGTSLVGTLFVLDEPSIGLHPRDTDLLLQILYGLRDQGNTVMVVEHDEAIIGAADHVLELGPRQGEEGGELVFEGSGEQLVKSKASLTGQYLTGKRKIELPKRRRPVKDADWVYFKKASKHNIEKLSFQFPLQRLVVVSGVSGSGKSTLVHEIIYKGFLMQKGQAVDEPAAIEKIEGAEKIEEVALVNQSPLSQTPRSTPLLYLGVYDAVRDLFAGAESAQMSGLTASDFSFNSGTGRCERCAGTGSERIGMQFLADLYVDCPVCEGRRFQKHVLEVTYRGKSIYDILQLTVGEGIHFFEQETGDAREKSLGEKIVRALGLLRQVGLSYMRLGQPLHQLSGGEAQRLKLVAYLVEHIVQKKNKTRLIILDEPTTGLHLEDVRVLLEVLQKLVDQGHSLLVIEHHLDVIKSADWVIDIGPEAGAGGGKIVTAGTPEEVAQDTQSITGGFLKPKLTKKLPDLQKTSRSRPSSAFAQTKSICIQGARHHNLKNISLSIPRDQMVVITGLSGSGKSTLAFDLLFSEGQRRYLDCLNAYARQFVEQLERPSVDAITGIPPAVAIEQRTSRGGGKSTVATVTELYQFMRLLYAKTGVQHDPQTGEPAVRQSVDQIVAGVKGDLVKQKRLLLLAPLVRGRKGLHTRVAVWAARKKFERLRVDGKLVDISEFKATSRYQPHDIDLVVAELSHADASVGDLVRKTLHYGKGTLYILQPDSKQRLYSIHLFCPGSGRSFEPLEPRMFSFNSPHGWCPDCQGFGVVVKQVSRQGDTQLEEELLAEQQQEEAEEPEQEVCPSCQGTRLSEVARAVCFGGVKVSDIHHYTVKEFKRFLLRLRWAKRDRLLARDILPEIEQRIHFLEQVGLDYLNLDRSAPTLSGGEAQRIRLAAQLGSNLQGALYILDEPTIGLHPRDNEQLLSALQALKQRGNSLVIVEHDEETMRRADQIIDLGPGAGVHGGRVIAQGSWKEISKKAESVTGMLLGKRLHHPLHGTRREVNEGTDFIVLQGARANNLRKIDVQIPLQRLVALSGVSGAGKSTLVRRVLIPAVESALSKKNKETLSKKTKAWSSIEGASQIQRIVEVDQSPIGKTSRSTVATYIGLMDPIRDLFAQLPDSRAAGFERGHFSYNSGAGRCPGCKGQGTVKVEMSFLPPTYVPCEVCAGRRWSEPILNIRYHTKNIFEVLGLSIDEAVEFFEKVPRLLPPLKLLQETGLGYLTLGQTSPTLSGGEAQRMKLVSELAPSHLERQRVFLRLRMGGKSHCLYVLEEPTVGLHLADVKRLIDLLHRLVDQGHSVVVIEHHLNVIAEADWVIELGPGSGEKGGKLVFSGTPEKLIRSKSSPTAPFLKQVLQPS